MGTRLKLSVPVFIASVLMSIAQAQSVPENPQPAAPATKSRVVPYRYQTHPQPKRTSQYYADSWGVGSLAVKSTDAGEVIRFSYRVLDREKAKALNDDKGNGPSLIDPEAGVKLILASLEKVGQSAQSAPQAGEVTWMAFSNPGRQVKPGHRVNVIVGQFRADGLVVQ
jgi:hypothetical protein